MEKVISLSEYAIEKSLEELKNRDLLRLEPTAEDNESMKIQLNPMPICSELNYIKRIQYPNYLLSIAQDKDIEGGAILMYAMHTLAVKDLERLALLNRAKKIRVISFSEVKEEASSYAITKIQYKAKVNNKISIFTASIQIAQLQFMCGILDANIDLEKSIMEKNGHYLTISDDARDRLLSLAKTMG